jgi:hypothetical protein
MQVGIDSFAAAFDENSRAVNPAERLRQLVQQIEHADEVGLGILRSPSSRRKPDPMAIPVTVVRGSDA